MKLTTGQLRFFKREGYLILRRVMDPELMARARERLWDDPPASLNREGPATWVGPLPEADRSDDSANMKREYRWQYRRIGREGWIVRMLPADPVIFGVAEQMLGAGRVQIPHGIRGIYCTLPYGDRPRPENGCHCDAHPFHLGVVGYIDDVEPDGGAFCVWPGSHREFYRTFTTGYMPDKTGEYEPLRERLNRQPPVDCHGSAGDVLFWHHRLGHMAGHNYSARIRQAVLYDFRRTDLEEVQGLPPPQDMWRDWSEELREVEL